MFYPDVDRQSLKCRVRKGSKFKKLSEVWRCLNILKEVDSSIDWHGYDCLTLQYTSNEFLKKYES